MHRRWEGSLRIGSKQLHAYAKGHSVPSLSSIERLVLYRECPFDKPPLRLTPASWFTGGVHA